MTTLQQQHNNFNSNNNNFRSNGSSSDGNNMAMSATMLNGHDHHNNHNNMNDSSSSNNPYYYDHHQQQQHQQNKSYHSNHSNNNGFVINTTTHMNGHHHNNGMDNDSHAIAATMMTDNIGTQDMTTLSNLSVEGINSNLRERYDGDLVYTYTGTILISVNPYKDLNIYGTPQITLYHNNSKSSSSSCTAPPPPHIYAIAEQAYNSLIRSYDEISNRTQNQSVVISGESGAGKTETTKFILQYLCHVTSNVSTWVENQILEANTILEAFGNAKTIRNDNSSRFGKFMQVCFDSKWMIRGCIIQDYLLEQSRITFQSGGERNYHVFYQLVSGGKTSAEISATYKLNQYGTASPTNFKYLQNQHETNVPIDPLLLALQILQIPQSHVAGLFSTLSSILHLGNLEFVADEGDGETAKLTGGDDGIIKIVAELLQVDEGELKGVLLSRQINVRGNITEIPLRVNEASENRHAMGKALYSKCFGWLIAHINERTNPGQDCSKVIGLLDIFGFENFGVNSFEQLCINYANEKLHKFFNQAVFSIEQEIYRSEGLNISEIHFTDNNAILELIEKPPRCILKLLTEQCHLPKGSDLGFLNNLHSEFEGVHPCYEKGDDRRNWDKRFTIKHYAGNVTYTVVGFVDKNRDVQQDLFFNILGESRVGFVRCIAESLFDSGITGGAAGTQPATTIPRNTSKGRPTVAETFRNQLQQLVEVLGATKAWYVRCIKPNEEKVPNSYDEGLVVEQLKYLGMLEIIRIRKEGYPVHMGFEEFSKRYRVIGKFRSYKGARDTCSQILETLNPDLPPPPHRTTTPSQKSTTYLKSTLPPYYYQLGHSKTFLKPQMHELLESKRSTVMTRHATTLQTAYRSYRARTHFKTLKSAIITIQRAYRSWTSRLLFIRKRRAAITIQCYLRGFFAREVACALREMRRVEEELRKREVEAEKRRRNSVICGGESSDDDGRLSSATSGAGGACTSDEDGVVGGAKDVSLDNLFEFLLVNSNNNNPDGSSNTKQLDKLSYEMDTLVNDLNGIKLDNNTQKQKAPAPQPPPPPPQSTTVTNSNSVCSSMSNFEIDNDAEFDADESVLGEDEDEDEDEINDLLNARNSRSIANTPTNEDELVLLPPPPPSPPPPQQTNENVKPIMSGNNNKVMMQQQQQHNRLPEPTEKPPPPPVQFQQGHGQVIQQQQNNAKQQAPLIPQQKQQQQQHQQSQQQQQLQQQILQQQQQQQKAIKANKKGADNNEPIYESIQPRIVPPPPPLQLQAAAPPPPPPPPSLQQIMQNVSELKPRVNIQQQQQLQKQQELMKMYKPITQARVAQLGGGQQQQQQQQQAPLPPVAAAAPLPSRVEKRVQEIINSQGQDPAATTQATAAIPTSEKIKSFRQYAHEYFSLENRSKSQSPEDYVLEHTSFTKNSHISHPHIHLYDPSNVQVACFMFRDLNKLMKGELKPDTETQALQTIIGYGIEREELRDEIYVQVLRQINGNGNVEWLEHLYLVFCLAIVSFPPGKVLGRVINYELGSISNGNAKLASQIKWILDNLQDLKIRGYVRKLPPSSVEIQAMKRLGTIVCRFFFLDGRTKAIDIHPTDTALDAILKLGEKIGVSCPSSLVENGWAVYQVRPVERVEEHVPGHAYIYDVIAGWELGNLDKERGVSLGCGDNRFVFKKRVFKGNNSREIPQDPVECALLYAQAVFCVVKRDDYPVAEKVALQLAGLQSQVLLGDPPAVPQPQQPQKLDNYTNIESYLPPRIARTRPHATWPQILAQAHRTYGAGKSELVARVWYLSCVMQYPLYGTTMFHVVYRGYWVYGNSLVLGISPDGISMIKSDDKFIMYEYAYNQIESVGVEVGERLVTINLNRSLPPDTHKCFVFESNSVSEIGGLIGSYCPGLGGSSSAGSSRAATSNNQQGSSNSSSTGAPPKPTTSSTIANQLTNQDRMRLYANVLNARKHLIESGTLKKPEKGLVGVNFLKNTLRRLSKHKIERMRQYEHAMMMMNNGGGGNNGGEDGGSLIQDFPLEWFCYSKHAISSSLTNLGQPELESTAIWMFGVLQSFAAFNPANSNSAQQQQHNSPMKTNGTQQTPTATATATTATTTTTTNPDAELSSATLLQSIFEKVWRSDPLLNELYVQLIKQTTDHPEPNSRVNSRNWGVLSLVCSVIAPPDPAVRKYLGAHLKRSAITDFVTEEGKYSRFAEKCLQHTISTSSLSQSQSTNTNHTRRQWPPSKSEIICTVNRKPITARFHFMDGKYHTLQFAPNDTASDLIASLTSKIGLAQGVKGYAIYEVSTTAIHNQSSPNGTSTIAAASSTPWERSLTPQEKPVEVIARWERQKSNQQQQQQSQHSTASSQSQSPLFKFIIRKHLYDSLDLTNPIEKELVYHQLLSSARNDRFPVSDTEAAMLVALQAQVELGDYNASAGEFPDYCHVSAHCLPTRIAALVSHEAVARHHQSLVGTGGGAAKQAVLNLMMSWPLYRCIVFDVTQSFTSNWPRSLWLALDNTGLHLLPQRTRHTLCTFEYGSIKSYSPSPTCFMVVTRGNGNAAAAAAVGGAQYYQQQQQANNKVVLSTNQAYQIAQLIKEFVYNSFVMQQQQQAQAQQQAQK